MMDSMVEMLQALGAMVVLSEDRWVAPVMNGMEYCPAPGFDLELGFTGQGMWGCWVRCVSSEMDEAELAASFGFDDDMGPDPFAYLKCEAWQHPDFPLWIGEREFETIDAEQGHRVLWVTTGGW
jgi:hypothetical protein